MKALIRGDEVITEPFSDWVNANMKWLTGEEIGADGEKLPGDGWTLVNDYVPDKPSMEELLETF